MARWIAGSGSVRRRECLVSIDLRERALPIPNGLRRQPWLIKRRGGGRRTSASGPTLGSLYLTRRWFSDCWV